MVNQAKGDVAESPRYVAPHHMHLDWDPKAASVFHNLPLNASEPAGNGRSSAVRLAHEIAHVAGGLKKPFYGTLADYEAMRAENALAMIDALPRVEQVHW